uniref:Glucosidase II subunit alpha n=1 Tax=Syphacia muris TaxID=451379 RepID=A0A158R4R6_9BILA
MILLRVFFLYVFLCYVSAVDRSNFKNCEQAAFCKRHRNSKEKPAYAVIPESVGNNASVITAHLRSSINTLRLTILSLKNSAFRVIIDEDDKALRPRYQPLDALNSPQDQQTDNFKYVRKDDSAVVAGLKNGGEIRTIYDPFKMLFYMDSEEDANPENDGDGFWEESFKSYKDSKPFGSSSVGIDISFSDFIYLYGLPEHGDSLALKSTSSGDPYRLYNLDVFEYEQDSRMALYGAVPYVIAHNKKRTVGVLWLNAAETWVDIKSSYDSKGILSTIVDKLTVASSLSEINAHFISESGLIDVTVMSGQNPSDLFRQYAEYTGVYPLPPLFSLAYHQSRWCYKDVKDVLYVNDMFDKYDIPVDVIWLDIDHTNGKRYFTWDPVKFADPIKMINGLTAKGRKLVTIVDPHVKKDDNYFIYKESKGLGFHINKTDGSTFEGNCWPGTSIYLDFLNPRVRDFWASKYAFDKYIGSTKDVFIWNDMNEPSVFSGPEVTMDKDIKHYGDWEHRDHSATYKGLLDRTESKLRPFLLSRSFFVGSQRTAAIWTGDNKADWTHLKATVPMLLSLSICGIPHVGADIGGFFGNPDEQLLTRWYQAAAFQPFFRAHAHEDTKRREPWLFSPTVVDAIRNAVKLRYSFLPYWYTLFYEHTYTGKPPMLPLWAEFPTDEMTFTEEKEWLVGSSILVAPILEKDCTKISIYFPGTKSTSWYDWESNKRYFGGETADIYVTLKSIPFFQRSGSIIPFWYRVRRASTLMRQDPITLFIAPSVNENFANGSLYLDDGETFGYKNGKYLHWQYVYKKESPELYSITSFNIDTNGKLDREIIIERITIRDVNYFPKNIYAYSSGGNRKDVEFYKSGYDNTLVIRKPGVPASKQFRIDIHL